MYLKCNSVSDGVQCQVKAALTLSEIFGVEKPRSEALLDRSFNTKWLCLENIPE